MKYLTPTDLAETLNSLDIAGPVSVLGGGTDLMIKIKSKRMSPEIVVDISKIDELKIIERQGTDTIVGSMVSPADIIAQASNLPKALVEACKAMGSPSIRNYASIGGNLGTASPAGDLSTALLGLGACVEIASASGTKVMPLDRFFLGPGATVLAKSELITKVIIPESLTSGFIKIGLRKSLSISVVAVAGSLYTDEENKLRLRLSLGSVAPTPLRATMAENKFALDANPHELGLLAAARTSPISDIRASGEYRREMVAALVTKLLEQMLAAMKRS